MVPLNVFPESPAFITTVEVPELNTELLSQLLPTYIEWLDPESVWVPLPPEVIVRSFVTVIFPASVAV